MKAAVISQGSVSSKWVIKALEKYFEKVDDLSINKIEVTLGEKDYVVLYGGKPIGDYECIYAKGSFKYADLLQAVTSALEDTTYMPVKSSAFTEGHDKLLTQIKLQKAKVPMPRTYMASTAEAAKAIIKEMNFPLIMKFPSGTHGKGVMFMDSYEAASSTLDALTALKQPFLVQEYIETGGVDTRAIVVGDKVVASMKRKAVKGEKRANIHAGGKGEACLLDANTQRIVVESAKAIGASVCAVDILEGAKGPMVIEVNLSPGLQGITKVTGIDVAAKIAKFVYEKAMERSEAGKKAGTKKILEEVGAGKEGMQELITTLDLRGNRILLPEMITGITKLDENQEVVLRAGKGRISITKFEVGEKEE